MDVIEIVRENLLAPLVGDQCAGSLIDDVLKFSPAVLQSSCFSLLVSKVLVLGIIVGGSIVKLPQIIKILNAGSTKGISLVSYIFETLALLIFVSYNFRKENPFSTYGEGKWSL